MLAATGGADCPGTGGKVGRLNSAVFALAVVVVTGLLTATSAAVGAPEAGFSATLSFGTSAVAWAAAVASFSPDPVAETRWCEASPDTTRGVWASDACAVASAGAADDGLGAADVLSVLSRSSSSSAWADVTSVVPVPVASSSWWRRRRPPRRPRRRREAPPSTSPPFSSDGSSAEAPGIDSVAAIANNAAALAASSSGSPVGRSAYSARGDCSARADQ